MDYKQEDFYGMRNRDSRKMPFYMTYPMQNIFLEEAEYERDMNRLKSMYPQEVREIQELVEEECDKMEYEGSLMFDEYPDRLMLRQICNRIYQKISEGKMVEKMETADFEAEQYEPLEAEELRIVGQQRPGRPNRPNQDSGLNNLIEVLLFNEMYNRRCRHRRCRRWW